MKEEGEMLLSAFSQSKDQLKPRNSFTSFLLCDKYTWQNDAGSVDLQNGCPPPWACHEYFRLRWSPQQKSCLYNLPIVLSSEDGMPAFSLPGFTASGTALPTRTRPRFYLQHPQECQPHSSGPSSPSYPWTYDNTDVTDCVIQALKLKWKFLPAARFPMPPFYCRSSSQLGWGCSSVVFCCQDEGTRFPGRRCSSCLQEHDKSHLRSLVD